MSIQPRYKFDPVSQKYTLLNAQEMAQRNIQERGGLGAMESPSPIYPMDGGGDGTVGSSSGANMMSPGMAEMGVGFQNAGLALSGIPSMTTAVAGAVASGIGNAMMGSEVSPVAPDSAQVSSIAPDPAFSGLAAMNAAVAAEDEAETQAAQAVSTASAIGEAAQQSQASPEAAAAAAAGPAAGPADAGVSDAGGSAMGDSGAGIGDVGGGDSGGFGGFGDSGGFGGGDGGGSTATGGSDSSSTGSGASDTGAADSGWRQGGIVMNYAQGGMAPQNYGRMGDSMMVHMSPQEVAGLQALARSRGTSMTINPNTGYPEAFNLNALLPVIAGLALGPAGLGLTAAQAGLAVGALGTATTGSLSKGIQAGLGAYGGAGIGGGFVDPSAAATTPPVGLEGAASGSAGITPPAASPTDFSVQPPLADIPSNQMLAGNPYAMSTGTTSPFGLNAPMTAPTGLETTGLAGSTAPVGAGMTVPPMEATTAQTAGLSAAPSSSPFANMSGKDMFKYGSAAAAPILGQMAEPVQTGMPSRRATYRPYDFSYNPVTSSYEPTPGDSSERVFLEPTFTPLETYTARSGGQINAYAAGGLAAFKAGGRPKSRPLMDENDLGGLRFYEMMGEGGSNLSSVEKNFAKGGMPPRFLSGGGDGMSDDIPAVIGDKQPARLADGEFVIPADVVSHIGNGSSKAGAKKLYEMMADIRKSRTGKTKQAPAIKPDKYMPA